MSNRVSQVVINGNSVTRFNGNNPSGGRQAGRPARLEAYGKKAKIIEWRKKKAEAEYTRRYLGGEASNELGR